MRSADTSELGRFIRVGNVGGMRERSRQDRRRTGNAEREPQQPREMHVRALRRVVAGEFLSSVLWLGPSLLAIRSWISVCMVGERESFRMERLLKRIRYGPLFGAFAPIFSSVPVMRRPSQKGMSCFVNYTCFKLQSGRVIRNKRQTTTQTDQGSKTKHQSGAQWRHVIKIPLGKRKR